MLGVLWWYSYLCSLSTYPNSNSDLTIILKSERIGFWDESEIIEYEDNDMTNHYRKEMTEINLGIKEADLN